VGVLNPELLIVEKADAPSTVKKWVIPARLADTDRNVQHDVWYL
jgi:hypothetical protein